MNKFIRSLCLALGLMLCIGLSSTAVFAAEPETSENDSRMVTINYYQLAEMEGGEEYDDYVGSEQVEVKYGVEYIMPEDLHHIPDGYVLIPRPFWLDKIVIDEERNEGTAYVRKVSSIPETTEPEVTEPETTEPATTEPEVTEPETTKPETTEPEVTEPETKPNETVPETKPSETTPATKPNADNSGKDNVPKTGDESHLMLWTAVASVSLIGVGAVVFTMKKKAAR